MLEQRLQKKFNSKMKVSFFFLLRSLCILFMLWSNSSFASIYKNVGFYCDDESIKKSYNGDSIHFLMLFSVLLGPFAFIVHKCGCILEPKVVHTESGSSKFHLYLHLKDYCSGFLYVLTVTETFKMLFSELRPHFFHTCKPDMSKIDCSKGLITTFNCTANEPKWLIERDIYKSFPSGHSSLSVYAFVFLTVFIYLKNKISKVHHTLHWYRFAPLLFFAWAVICCMSRILDNRHFWWDVLTGAFIGIIGGYSMAKISIGKAS